MDVIGNNIANVNTAGYKTARVIFQDIFSQNVASGMANQGSIGGTNPRQIGLGIRLSTVDVIHSRAAFQRTDKETDMMINGDGYFIVSQQNMETGQWDYVYTRAGNFDIDNEGYLVTSGGLYVMGRTFELEMGVVSAGNEAMPRRDMIRPGAFNMGSPEVTWPAVADTTIGAAVAAAAAARTPPITLDAGWFTANPAGFTLEIGESWSPPAGDPRQPIPATARTFTSLAALTAAADTVLPGHAALTVPAVPPTPIPANGYRVGDILPAGLFGPGTPPAQVIINEANIGEWNDGTVRQPVVPWPAQARPEVPFTPARPPIFGLVASDGYTGIEEPDAYGLTRIRLTTEQIVLPLDPNTGLPIGYPERIEGETDAAYTIRLEAWLTTLTDTDEISLPGFSVADNGDVSVIVGNRKLVIGQLALAMFANASGLEKAGNSLYRESASSGPVIVTEAFMDGAGKIDGGGLEMSNVDLANEFTDMIVTQRGFQANSRIITVSDTMLEELVNLKR